MEDSLEEKLDSQEYSESLYVVVLMYSRRIRIREIAKKKLKQSTNLQSFFRAIKIYSWSQVLYKILLEKNHTQIQHGYIVSVRGRTLENRWEILLDTLNGYGNKVMNQKQKSMMKEIKKFILEYL